MTPHLTDVAGEWPLVLRNLSASAGPFAAELAVCGTVVTLLLMRLCGFDRRVPAVVTAFAGSLIATVLACTQWGVLAGGPAVLFGGLVIHDPLTVLCRVLIFLSWNLTVTLTALSGVPDREDGPDFHVPLAGIALGAVLMAQANHLLTLFLAVEMASVPAYVLVGFRKGRRQSGEAALKYLVYGAGAAGVMMFGVSLLAGAAGGAGLAELGPRLAVACPDGLFEVDGERVGPGRAVLLGAVFVLVGLAFKLALAPFHFWCPDAFEGALAEVAGLMSVAPKVGAFALLLRFGAALAPGGEAGRELLLGLGLGCGGIAVLSMTFGNLAALAQTDLKRLLAYSTVAQAGTILTGVAVAFVGLAGGTAGRQDAAAGFGGVLFYLVAYVFLNLGAFAAVTLLRNRTYRTTVDSLAGLGRRLPVAGACTTLFLIGLVGLPPTGGFVGKLLVFAAGFGSASPWLWAVAAAGCLNTVISLFYYLRPVRALYTEPDAETPAVRDARPVTSEDAFLLVLAVPVVVLGVFFGRIAGLTAAVAETLVP